MMLSNLMKFVIALIIALSFAAAALAQDSKPVLLNTLGACLKVPEFRALIKNEAKSMKNGDILKLIVDTRNEPEAGEAIKQEGHPVIETTQDAKKDSTTYTMRIRK